MQVLAGPFAAVAALLVVAGVAKVRRPAPTAGALAALRLPSAPALVVALGLAEAAVGLGALALGTRPLAALVAACYLGFAAFVAAAVARRGAVGSCGCFGADDAPPGWVHLGLDLAAGGVAGAAAAWPAGPLAGLAGVQPQARLPLVVLAAACAWLAFLGLRLLPATLAAARAGGAR